MQSTPSSRRCGRGSPRPKHPSVLGRAGESQEFAWAAAARALGNRGQPPSWATQGVCGHRGSFWAAPAPSTTAPRLGHPEAEATPWGVPEPRLEPLPVRCLNVCFPGLKPASQQGKATPLCPSASVSPRVKEEEPPTDGQRSGPCGRGKPPRAAGPLVTPRGDSVTRMFVQV